MHPKATGFGCIFSVNNIDRYFLSGALRIGADDCTDLFGDAALTADHLAHVLLGNRKLEDAHIPAHLLQHDDLVGIVHDGLYNVSQNLFHRRKFAPFRISRCVSLQHPVLLQQRLDGVGRLRAVLDPLLGLVGVDLEKGTIDDNATDELLWYQDGYVSNAKLTFTKPAGATDESEGGDAPAGPVNAALGKSYTIESDAPNENSLGTTEEGGKDQLTDGAYGTSEYYSGLWAHFVNAYGRTVTIDELMNEEGYEAVFIGSGAGLPRFMGIPGENLNGVVSANEFLTRTNLMKAYDTHYDTPIYVGQRVVVVGGGNVAMDAVRTAKRLGAEATIVYRRSEKELPARVEEVHHAKEEGIEFRMLTNPTSIIGDEKGWVVGISCVEMELGEPDESGRRSPIEKAGSDFEIPCDVVIMALGTSPNPLLKMTTEGLETNRKGCLVADEKGATTREGIFAGGDAVTGAATVILAMGAGRKAAKSIDEYIRQKKH